jgi:thiol-disulfide isomerase/thioredoxin
MVAKTKKNKSSTRSVMGKLLPPVDVTSTGMLGELEKRIAAGPITLVLIYADWCGHCQRFKPMMEQLESCPGRSVQVARVRDDVLPNSPLANIPNEGYPSLMLINQDGTPATFKNNEGKTTNVIPDHTDMVKMTTLVRNAGTPEGLNLVNGSASGNANSIQEMSEPSIGNLSHPSGANAPNLSGSIPKNIVADRLSPANVARLNETLVNSKNTLLKEATKPISGGGQGGGSLFGSLLAASQRLAPAAALFLAADVISKKPRNSRKTRRTRKGKRKN